MIELELPGARPITFAAGSLTTGALTVTWPGPPGGFVDIYLGVDLYPDVQPNNGTCSVFAAQHATLGLPITILQVQQSANFPGPFFWRGLCPIYPGTGPITAEATVPFTFSAWGVQIAANNLDL